MSIAPQKEGPIEIGVREALERTAEGKRIVEGMELTVYHSTLFQEFSMSTGRWEGGRTYKLTWPEFVAMYEAMGRQIEFLQPLIDSGEVVVEQKSETGKMLMPDENPGQPLQVGWRKHNFEKK